MENSRKTYITDVLVVGGGLGGAIMAQKLHALKPDVKIAIMEKGYFGYTGQTTKAGHGMCMLSPEAGDDIYAMCKEQVEVNPYGTYLNDQEYLMEYQKEQYTYIQELERMGGKFSHEPDTARGRRLHPCSFKSPTSRRIFMDPAQHRPS